MIEIPDLEIWYNFMPDETPDIFEKIGFNENFYRTNIHSHNKFLKKLRTYMIENWSDISGIIRKEIKRQGGIIDISGIIDFFENSGNFDLKFKNKMKTITLLNEILNDNIHFFFNT